MTWNYRIVKETTSLGPYLSIREIYRRPNGKIIGYTQNAQSICGDTMEELLTDLGYYLRAFSEPILTIEELDGEIKEKKNATKSKKSATKTKLAVSARPKSKRR